MKLLIVDDQVLFRNGLVSLFRSQPDYQVVGEAGSVHEAIEKARQLRPDLILMDFGLPDGTGLEATQVILSEMPECKIVYLTVYETNEKLFAGIRSGAKGYLLKNSSITQLLDTLKSLSDGKMALTAEMSSRIVEAFANTPSAFEAGEDPFARLSPRELEILRELVNGGSNKKIAQRLFLAENTVKHHIHNILDKLELKNRRQAISYARRNGLVGSQEDQN